MPQPPFPLGEPVIIAGDAIPSYGDGSDPPRSPRPSATWQDLAWVGFEEAVAPRLPVSAVERVPDVPPAARIAAEAATFAPELHLDPDDAWDGRAERSAGPPAAIRERAARADVIRAAVAGIAGRIKSLSSGISRLLRLAVAAALTGAIAVFAYQGGERLAELVGPVASSQAPAHPAVALAAPEVERATPAPGPLAGAVADSAAALKGQAALYIERATAGDAAAQYNLAVLYVRGDGMAQDFGRAAAWFRAAAAAGNVDAQYDLAVMYERGLGVEQNPGEAVRWYERAAARNHAAAQYNLGLAYAEGRGVARDPTMAATWYRQAAARRLLPAMFNLAILYDKGEGVGRSLTDAYAWYRAAARSGDAVAAKRAQEVFDRLVGPEKGKAVIAAASVVEMIDKTPAAPTPLVPAGTAESARTAPAAKPSRAALAGQPAE